MGNPAGKGGVVPGPVLDAKMHRFIAGYKSIYISRCLI
jgi:hypothetical protein